MDAYHRILGLLRQRTDLAPDARKRLAADIVQANEIAAAPDTDPADEAFRAAAAAQFAAASDGDLDIDADAVVSWGGDDGCYVAAWVWVTFDDAGYHPEE